METLEIPRVVIGVLIYRENSDIFLMRSHKWADKWVVPGGHVEFGESLKDAVRREIKEETGMDISDIEFLEVSEGIFPPEFHSKKHFIYIHYRARAISDDVVLNDEAEEYTWVAPKDSLSMDLVPSVRTYIKNYLARS